MNFHYFPQSAVQVKWQLVMTTTIFFMNILDPIYTVYCMFHILLLYHFSPLQLQVDICQNWNKYQVIYCKFYLNLSIFIQVRDQNQMNEHCIGLQVFVTFSYKPFSLNHVTGLLEPQILYTNSCLTKIHIFSIYVKKNLRGSSFNAKCLVFMSLILV